MVSGLSPLRLLIDCPPLAPIDPLVQSLQACPWPDEVTAISEIKTKGILFMCNLFKASDQGATVLDVCVTHGLNKSRPIQNPTSQTLPRGYHPICDLVPSPTGCILICTNDQWNCVMKLKLQKTPVKSGRVSTHGGIFFRRMK
jgi:hypothetical protein